MTTSSTNIKIKICGLNDESAVEAVIKSGADYAGFVFHKKSPRHVEIDKAAKLIKKLPENIKSVMVMVDPDDDLLEKIAKDIKPDFFQLHGDETVERIVFIRSKFPEIGIIKAIAVSGLDDVKKSQEFLSVADFILFDAKPTSSKMLKGGNGVSFDWALLSGIVIDGNWFLSGGLNPMNIRDAIEQTSAKFVDVSSGVERMVGVKDYFLIEYFIRNARGEVFTQDSFIQNQ